MPEWRRNPAVIATELEGETVLLDPATRDLFTLNETGQVVWAVIEDGVDAVVARLTSAFAVPADTARADALELVAALADAGLLSPAS